MNYKFKLKNGILMAKRIASYDARVLKTGMRVLNGRQYKAHLIYSKGSLMAIASSGLSTRLMSSHPVSAKKIGTRGSVKVRNILVYYEKPVIMVYNLMDGKTYVTDAELNVLSGSNIFNDSAYCLGESVNFMTFHPLEVLMTNKANMDLGWRGPDIEFEQINKQKLITTWPTIEKLTSKLPHVANLLHLIGSLDLSPM